MATEKQIQANRANALKSTGPPRRFSPLAAAFMRQFQPRNFAETAAAFRSLADSSRTLALQQRFETAYDRQYNHALTLFLKLHETPNPTATSDPPIQLATETWEDDFQGEPNFSAEPETDLTCNE